MANPPQPTASASAPPTAEQLAAELHQKIAHAHAPAEHEGQESFLDWGNFAPTAAEIKAGQGVVQEVFALAIKFAMARLGVGGAAA